MSLDTVCFGRYPQSPAGDDETAIRWLVLDRSDGVALLLSERLLDSRRFHHARDDVGWRGSDIRTWLNTEFLDSAFDDSERGAILVDDPSPLAADRIGDAVFLLSPDELLDVESRVGALFRRAIGTDWAKRIQLGQRKLYVYDKGVDADYETVDGERRGASWWLLRNGGNAPARTAFIGARASLRHYAYVDLAGYGIRPAIRVDAHALR